MLAQGRILVTVSTTKRGKRTRITKTFAKMEEAKVWALNTELKKSQKISLQDREQLFTEYAWHWLETKRLDVKDSTYQHYKRYIKLFEKLFKNLKLKDLNDVVMQRGLDEYARPEDEEAGKPHSKKTVAEFLKVLRAVIRYGYAHGLIYIDFSSLLKNHGHERLDKLNKAMSMDDMQRLKAYVIEHAADDEFNVLTLLALDTGMRRGELLALKPCYIVKDSILIRESVSPFTRETSVKTKCSRRDITVPSRTVKIVQELIQRKGVGSEERIFDTGGFHQSIQLGNLQKKLGIPETTFHALRDTHASFLFNEDIDQMYVSKRLGHASLAITQQYYLELMAYKKHAQDGRAMELLASI